MVNDSWAYIDRIKRNGDEQKQKAFKKLLAEELSKRHAIYASLFNYAGDDES